MRRGTKRALLVIAGVILAALAGFVAWGLTPLGPTEEASAALQSDEIIAVADNGEYITFTPVGLAPVSGLILYPGGHVDYRSYAPLAREMASRGYLVVIVRMPLSLAVFGIDRADPVIAAHPGIRYWVIGGHSLGGSMAATYATDHLHVIQGIVLYGSFPAANDDLSGSEIKGLTTYGSNDQVLDKERYHATLTLLPPRTIRQVIDGGNHAQFGNYGPQPGDGIATISPEEQQKQAADLTVRLLRAVEGE